MSELIIPSYAALIAAAILLAQGISIAIRGDLHKHVRWFGFLTVALAGFGFLGFALFESGIAVYSREFSLLMVQGPAARAGLGVLLFAVGVLASLTWSTARLAANADGRHLPLVLLGLTIGLLANFQIVPLNEDDPWAFRVYRYDFWSPLLMIWIMVCFLEGALTLLRTARTATRWFCAAALIGGVGVWILEQPDYLDADDSLRVFIWGFTALIAVPVSTAIGGWLAVLQTGETLSAGKKMGRLAFVLVGAIVGLYVVANLLSEPLLDSYDWSRATGWIVWFGWIVLTFGWRIIAELWSALREGRLKVPSVREHMRQMLLVIDLLVIALSVAILFYNFVDIDASLVLITFFGAWAILTEIITDGVLHNIYELMRKRSLLSYIAAKFVAMFRLLGIVFTEVSEWFKSIFSATSTAGAILKAIFGLAVLIAVSEIPNAGKTVVTPFDVPKLEQFEGVEEQITERLKSSLAQLGQQIRTEFIVRETVDKQIQVMSLGSADTGIETALVGSSDIEIGTVKIPLGMLVSPIKRPMRWLLNVRMVTGSLHHTTSTDTYTLFANSGQGDSWMAQSDRLSGPLTPVQSCEAGNSDFADASVAVREELVRTPANANLQTSDTIALLVEELAFEIIRADSNMDELGMTDSWRAFESFRFGVRDFEQFNQGNVGCLTSAINHFYDATKLDPKFALAQHRLALALLKDGQPQSAVVALRAAIRENAGFLPAYETLASILYNYDNWYYRTAVTAGPAASADAVTARENEAVRWWRLAVQHNAHSSAAQTAEAYNALGKYERSEGTLQSWFLAYFYFKRAERFYSSLPDKLRNDAVIRSAEGDMFNNIAVTIGQIDSVSRPLVESTWHCASGYLEALPDSTISGSNNSQSVLAYYRQARERIPNEPIVACNFASEALFLGDSTYMNNLVLDAEAHAQMAGSHANAGDYAAALAEYSVALDLDPGLLSALNSYAYTYWLWRLNSAAERAADGSTLLTALAAEQFARRAVNLAEAQRSNDAYMYESTLGEVLLASGRSFEAIEVLESAEAKTATHAMSNEVRWDLAQAYICAAELAASEEEARQLLDKANDHHAAIRRSEIRREFRPFTDNPALLDPATPLPGCLRTSANSVEGESLGDNAPFVLTGGAPANAAAPVADWIGITWAMNGHRSLQEAENVFLHIWGGGLDTRSNLFDETNGDTLQLSARMRDTKFYYFAQLRYWAEDESGISTEVRLSDVVPLQTFEDQDKNLIVLNFACNRSFANEFCE